MPQFILARRTVAFLAVSVALTAPHSRLLAQRCGTAGIDSASAAIWVDSLEHHRPRPASVDSLQSRPRRPRHAIEIRTVGVESDGGCWTAVALNWDSPLRGALALVRPDGALYELSEFADIRGLQPAGPGRLAFTYRVGAGTGYGRGVRSYSFTVLCNFGGWHWTTCLDLPAIADQNTAPERVAPDSSVGTYTTDSASFSVQGDSVLVHRYFEWATVYHGGSLGGAHRQDLGRTIVKLPRIER